VKTEKMIKRIININKTVRGIVLILLLVSFILPVTVLALEPTLELTSPIKHNTFKGLIYGIVDVLFTISLILAPLFLIVGGFYFISSVGDISKVAAGKKIILFTLIGFVIILLAKGIVELFEEALIGDFGGEEGEEVIQDGEPE
jgi:hypothetical protein